MAAKNERVLELSRDDPVRSVFADQFLDAIQDVMSPAVRWRIDDDAELVVEERRDVQELESAINSVADEYFLDRARVGAIAERKLSVRAICHVKCEPAMPDRALAGRLALSEVDGALEINAPAQVDLQQALRGHREKGADRIFVICDQAGAVAERCPRVYL